MKNPRKKVLIITYYWPPCGGIGVLRCLKIAKYLRQFGWEPIIYTADDAHYPSIDYSNEKDIPQNITILRHKIWEPYHIYKFITGQKKDANVNNVFYVKDEKLNFFHKISVWIRSNFFIPDARALWIKPSVKYLEKYLKDNQVDAIFSDGPPHSNTRIATILKKRTNVPWLADFQDPWTQIDYYHLLSLSYWGDKKHKKLEQEVFTNADKITIVSETWKKELETIGAKNVSVVPWGFDPDDYKNIESTIDEHFTITHLGILGYDRNPITFFKVLKKLIDNTDGLKHKLLLQLVGQVDYSVIEAYTKLGLEPYVRLIGSVSRNESIKIMAKSNVLLLLLNQQANAKGRIPGKLFEYLAVRRPIFCLEPLESDVSQIIAKTNGGYVANYENELEIENSIKLLFNKFNNKELTQPIQSKIDDYSVIKLTERIANFLDELLVK